MMVIYIYLHLVLCMHTCFVVSNLQMEHNSSEIDGEIEVQIQLKTLQRRSPFSLFVQRQGQ